MLFYEILDRERREMLPILKNFKQDFYLAGGTSLALQIGHRKSIDFDFFTSKSIDTSELFEKSLEIFTPNEVLKIQEEKNTLSLFVNKNIKISFFKYKYPLVKKLKEEKSFQLASILDIAAMKLAAIISRSTQKDFVDLYFILQNHSLEEVLLVAKEKFKDINDILFLKAMTFFDDIEEDPVEFVSNKKIEFSEIKNFLVQAVKKYNFSPQS